MKRTGKFTIANLLGTFLLAFILYVFFPIMNMGLNTSWSGANFLTKAALVLIIPGLLFAVLGYPLVQSQPQFENVEQMRRRRTQR